MSNRGNRFVRASRGAVRVKRPHIPPVYHKIAAISASAGTSKRVRAKGYRACSAGEKCAAPRPEKLAHLLQLYWCPLYSASAAPPAAAAAAVPACACDQQPSATSTPTASTS